MKGQSEYERGYAAGVAAERQRVREIREVAGTERGRLLCGIGRDLTDRANELRTMLDNGVETPEAIVQRLFVQVEWCAEFISTRGLQECTPAHLPRA
jgi:hypothetical protein